MYLVIPGGAWPILRTPFTADDQTDLNALDERINFYVNLEVAGRLELAE